MFGNPGDAATNNEVEALKAQLEETQKRLEVAEQRRKDTLSGYTKGQQKIKAMQAEIDALKDRVTFEVPISEELEQLKYDDPDEWRRQMNKLEKDTYEKYRSELKAKQDALEKEDIVAQRAQVLKEFNENHPDLQITDELIQTEIPPRLLKKLDEGGAFEEVLEDIYNYMTKQRKIGDGQEVLDQPNLSKMAGGTKPSATGSSDDDDDYLI